MTPINPDNKKLVLTSRRRGIRGLIIARCLEKLEELEKGKGSDPQKGLSLSIGGLAAGQGTLTRPNGDRYEGEFENSAFNGKGVFVRANGDKYTGEFKDGLIHGQGVLNYANGDIKDGEFGRGNFIKGKVIHIDSSGDRFEVDCLNGMEGCTGYKIRKEDGAKTRGKLEKGNWVPLE